MIMHPNFDPVALKIGPLAIHWYGLMYLIGFIAVLLLGNYRARKPDSGWNQEQVSDLLFYGALGVILGGRFGYVLFYKFGYYLAHPLEVFYIWTGGMSFHGGLLGVLAALWLFARNNNKHFLAVGDFVAPLCAIGLGAGRMGNFINQELWGRISDVPWAVVFQNAGPDPRHPSQLYEAFLEGAVLFAIVWLYSSKPRPLGAVSGLFLICYGLFRILVEFVREPDAHLGFVVLNWATMGQILSVPLVLIGVWLWWRGHRISV
ncbi:prolipoprotein diacylglyceryl transferase [Pseudomonadota bacterium]